MKAGVGGIIHSDEKLDKYKFTDKEIEAVKGQLGCASNDAFILVVAPKDKAQKAITAALDRASMLKNGVLGEVRKPNADGTTSFMRPIPGAARMYPETDVLPIRPDTSNIKLPELLEEKEKRYVKDFNLAKDLAHSLARSDKFLLFEQSTKDFTNVKPAFIGETLISLPKTLKRKHNINTDNIKNSDFIGIFKRLDSGELTKDPIEDILISLAKGNKVDYKKYAPLTDAELEQELRRILKESKELAFNAIMGKAMGTLKGKAEGKKIVDMLQRLTDK